MTRLYRNNRLAGASGLDEFRIARGSNFISAIAIDIVTKRCTCAPDTIGPEKGSTKEICKACFVCCTSKRLNDELANIAAHLALFQGGEQKIDAAASCFEMSSR
jgi:hypothetical protein